MQVMFTKKEPPRWLLDMWRVIAEISSSGERAPTESFRPSAARACAETGTDFADRGHTPPPGEISAGS